MAAGSVICAGPARSMQAAAPADRVTRETVRAFNRHLETIVAPRTRLSMLVGLKVTMQAMASDRNWRWLQDACNRVQINAKPSRDKRARMRPTAEIFAAALTELEQLPADGSVREADAWPIAMPLCSLFLAAGPLRVKNFSALALGRHLVGPGRGMAHHHPGRGDQNPSASQLRVA